MNIRRIAFLLIAIALMLSCSMPFFAGPTGGPTATPPPASAPSDTVAAAPPTDTQPPITSETPTIFFTDTPGVPTVAPIDQNVNCRFGPSTDYEAQGSGLLIGKTAQITGKSEDGKWWQIPDPSSPGLKCWVGAMVTTASGDLSAVPVLPAPQAFVTDASIQASPSEIDVPGCSFPAMPVEITRTITTNGPVNVKFRLEVLGDTPTETMNFTKFGTQSVSDHHNVGMAGTFTVKLVVLSPNSLTVTDTFKVVCT